MSRGWTWLDYDNEEGHGPAVQAQCDYLAKTISDIEHQAEQAMFARQSAYENYEDDEPEYETEEESDAAKAVAQLQHSIEDSKLNMLYESLHKLGARMMRPYEHHNEDERMIEYLETRYDSYCEY